MKAIFYVIVIALCLAAGCGFGLLMGWLLSVVLAAVFDVHISMWVGWACVALFGLIVNAIRGRA